MRFSTEKTPARGGIAGCKIVSEAVGLPICVVAHEAPAKVHMLGAPLEMPVFKQRDGASVVFSDRCRGRLDEA
jgi:hypothetical protein